MKLGAEYETDFVVVNEGYSDGTLYELIELETPHCELFDKRGNPTARFNTALQQIRDWKRYLINNKDFFRQTFPSTSTRIINNSKISFKIIIGRTLDNIEHLQKRKQISELENVEIVSYDRLTEMAVRRHFMNSPQLYSAEMDRIIFSKRNALANPFFECTLDSEWKKLCKHGNFHFYSTKIDAILNARSYNLYFEEYKQYLKNENIIYIGDNF